MEQGSSNTTSTIPTEDDTTPFAGHLAAGGFCLAFGGFFLGLTAYRLNRIAAALAFLERSETASSPRHNGTTMDHSEGNEDNVDDHHQLDLSEATDGEDPADYMALWARTFCRQHIPECDAIVIYRTTLALLTSTVCGFVLESAGSILMHLGGNHHHDATNDASWVSYGINETILLLFIAAGGTGWWEAHGYLPRDSFRVALVWAFGGEALLWHIHAATKSGTTTTWILEAMSWLSSGTAVTMLLSVLCSNTTFGTAVTSPRSRDGLALDVSVVDTAGDYPCTLFFLYTMSYVLITWQGCWFITAGRHSSTHSQGDRVPCYFILQGIILFVLVQAFFIIILYRYKPKRHYGRLRQRQSSIIRERSPATVEVELNGI
mmetsp:Transcript_16437/g.33161  ORF Transcript_16437/g.33161 Transcript_16437/m.33161 type:complete len:376 (+) Transcript_16437:114-1241(+)